MVDELRSEEMPDTFTRSQLLTMRGYPSDVVEGNGKHLEPQPEEGTASVLEAVCAFEGCTEPAAGKSLYCGDSHRKKAKAQRVRDRAALLPQEATNGRGMDETPSLPPALSPSGPFERLAGVASMLPPGWSAELSQSQVIIRW